MYLSANLHKERRNYLRTALHEMSLILSDQPGLLAPKVWPCIYCDDSSVDKNGGSVDDNGSGGISNVNDEITFCITFVIIAPTMIMIIKVIINNITDPIGAQCSVPCSWWDTVVNKTC